MNSSYPLEWREVARMPTRSKLIAWERTLMAKDVSMKCTRKSCRKGRVELECVRESLRCVDYAKWKGERMVFYAYMKIMCWFINLVSFLGVSNVNYEILVDEDLERKKWICYEGNSAQKNNYEWNINGEWWFWCQTGEIRAGEQRWRRYESSRKWM